MRILGIETSCDETAAAVVEDGSKIISNVIASSSEMHIKTGGIIPESAARQQIKFVIPVISKALENEKVDAIAVTVGPGLIGSLLVGVETAKTLSMLWEKPIIPVNHLVAHIYANWVNDTPEFPALALVVSGGHTDLVLMKGHGKITWIGGTRDDAAGEAFDKCARLLGLPYPGGPSVSKEAGLFRKNNPKQNLNLFPRPMIDEDNFDLSFSGLKTAVRRGVEGKKVDTSEICANVEEAIVDCLVDKSIKAIKKLKPKSFLLAGGVAANLRLREKFKDELSANNLQVEFHVPEAKLCTDNAVSIASYAHFNHKPVSWEKVTANPELTITS